MKFVNFGDDASTKGAAMMEAWEVVVILLLIGPVSVFVSCVYVLSALGKSLGFRRKYVQMLLYIFEVRNRYFVI